MLLSSRRNLARKCLILCAVLLSTALYAADVWNAPAFTADADAWRKAAAGIKPQSDNEATILLKEISVTIDAAGKMATSYHTVYRIENQNGVEDWAETSGTWEPWYQSKPEIKARVIAPDGSVHMLDPKTLSDVPVHENAPEMYSDERSYGGPLPAVAPGVIVEEDVTIRDTAPFFAGGTFQRYSLISNVPVARSRFILSHAESFPVRYALRQLPDATTSKTTADGVETITIEKNSLEAYRAIDTDSPGDAVMYPQVEVSTSSSWQQVASEYSRAVDEKLRLADVQPILAKLDLKSASRQQSIEKLVSALHNNVRYTGVEFGESALIPQFPSETLKRKYGDCKDKAALLVALLRAAGIDAKVALLSTGPGQDVNPDLPGMGAFDHAIVYVPATDSAPELWIDATAQYSKVGYLPAMDYGRLALIADKGTSELKKIPELTSAQNVHTETREVFFADYGPAKFVEKDEQIGVRDANYREHFRSDSKELKESNEKYVKNTYLADSIGSFEQTEPSDLTKPFAITFTATGKRGFTELNYAYVYVRFEDLFNDLPDYFYQKEEEPKEESQLPKPKVRTVDWQIVPVVNEWRYRINAPSGFKVRAVPVDKEEPIGVGKLTRHFKANGDGTVLEAVFRFDSGKSRLTAAEAMELRDAIIKASNADPLEITFDHAGYSLLSQGKIKEALAVDRQLVAEHPKEALHRMRLAMALLEAGLGEKARATAKEAVALDPKSHLAFNTLGWVLQHDLLGRLRHEGFDYEGALAAYRKAEQLDPKSKPNHADYAILLEFDAHGVRYSDKAHLEEAIAEYKGLKKLDETYFRDFEDNLLRDLWYAKKYAELKESIAGVTATPLRKSLLLASIAATTGPENAISKSLEIVADDEGRVNVLRDAAFFVLYVKNYPLAAALYSAAAHGKYAAQLASFAEMVRKVQPSKDAKTGDSGPLLAVSRLLDASSHPMTLDQLTNLASENVLQLYDKKDLLDRSNRTFEASRLSLETSNIPMDILIEVGRASAKYNVEGDDKYGYRVVMQLLGAKTQNVFLVREHGEYKIANIADEDPELAAIALARLEQGDLPGARKWLDWLREDVHMGGGDDPLSGPVFPHFWIKGQDGDLATARLAALASLAKTKLIETHIPELVKARNDAKIDADRNNLDLVLANAYVAQKRWNDLLTAAQSLMKVFPESLVAYNFATEAYAHLNRLDDWEMLVQERLKKHPDDPDYERSLARLYTYRGDLAKAMGVYKKLIDDGKGSEQDSNNFGWVALQLPGPVDHETVEIVERANQASKNQHFSIMHTLVCLYAAQGRTKEARELLLKTMEAGGLSEPDSEIWFALGLIAEQYGEADVARTMYARVEKGKVEVPGTSYQLAQQRVAALPPLSNGGSKGTAAK